MSQYLLHEQAVDPVVWAYLATLLVVALFFKFSRFWSVRNLDLILLLLASPGLLLQHAGQVKRLEAQSQLRNASPTESPPVASDANPDAKEGDKTEPPTNPPKLADSPQFAEFRRLEDSARLTERIGFIWLLSASALYLIRLLLDSTMVRRPLLEPNLSPGGLAFLGVALLLFVTIKVMQGTPTDDDLQGAKGARQFLVNGKGAGDDLRRHGPGYALLHCIPSILTYPMLTDESRHEIAYVRIAKGMAIASQLAILFGIVAVAYWHFNNLKMGIGAAVLYLMLPYTMEMSGRVSHLLPGALLVWAVAWYRRPLTAGLLLGTAAGVSYYPLFLLPLWISFYWPRGLGRLLMGTGLSLFVMALSLLFTTDFGGNVQKMFGIWTPVMDGLEGIWGLGWDPVFRIPVLTAFVALSGSLALWPAQKNLGTLLGCSAAMMVATQFWHGFGGGLFMAWYLPLTLLTVVRPNLEDRIALTVLSDRWFSGRRVEPPTTLEKAP